MNFDIETDLEKCRKGEKPFPEGTEFGTANRYVFEQIYQRANELLAKKLCETREQALIEAFNSFYGGQHYFYKFVK